MMKALSIFLVLLIGLNAYADDIEVPEEELARETTLPVFSKRRIVLNRNVVTAQRWEFGAGAGMEMNEPFYNPYLFTFHGTYNLTDVSAANVQALYWMKGLSSYGEQLKQGFAQGADHEYFDASKAPHPVWAVFANYEYVAYYGKISVTKKAVMNLNTFGLLGLGYINMDKVSSVAMDIGVGQNFFFTKNFGVRWDLKWLIYQGPDPTSQRLLQTDNPSAGSFSNRIYYNSQLGLSAVLVL